MTIHNYYLKFSPYCILLHPSQCVSMHTVLIFNVFLLQSLVFPIIVLRPHASSVLDNICYSLSCNPRPPRGCPRGRKIYWVSPFEDKVKLWPWRSPGWPLSSDCPSFLSLNLLWPQTPLPRLDSRKGGSRSLALVYQGFWLPGEEENKEHVHGGRERIKKIKEEEFRFSSTSTAWAGLQY